MIPIYSFEHEARQIWENGRAIRIDATTNQNGKELHITVRPAGRGYIRTVNGRVDRFDGSMAVLAFWNKDTLRHHAFFSAVEDETIRASFEFAGKERITIAGAELEVEHYRMVGDEERELWYDAAGHLAKVRLSRLGSEIEYVRDQLTPRSQLSEASWRKLSAWSRNTITAQRPRRNRLGSISRLNLPASGPVRGRFSIRPRTQPEMPSGSSV